jgi:hypothetical protein
VELELVPTFLASQVGSIREKGVEVEFEKSWFEGSERKLEIELIGLAVAHTKILDLFDECFDGPLDRDEEWKLARTAIGMIARKLGSDLGFDRVTEEYERRIRAEETDGSDAS